MLQAFRDSRVPKLISDRFLSMHRDRFLVLSTPYLSQFLSLQTIYIILDGSLVIYTETVYILVGDSLPALRLQARDRYLSFSLSSVWREVTMKMFGSECSCHIIYIPIRTKLRVKRDGINNSSITVVGLFEECLNKSELWEISLRDVTNMLCPNFASKSFIVRWQPQSPDMHM